MSLSGFLAGTSATAVVVRACEGLGPRPGQFECDNNRNANDGIELIAYRGVNYLAASLNDNSSADIGSDSSLLAAPPGARRSSA